MSKLNNIIKVIIIIVIIIILAIMVCVGIVLNWARNTEIKMIGKTYVDFVVLLGEVIDYKDFIVINDRTSQLEQIDEDIRQKISNYMKDNNLKLKEGHHYFNRIDGTYDEYINDNFKFEKLE